MVRGTKPWLSGPRNRCPGSSLPTRSCGKPRSYARIKRERLRREDDGTFTQIKTTFHHLVMSGHSAEHADEQIAKRDNFTAEVCTRMIHYEYDSG